MQRKHIMSIGLILLLLGAFYCALNLLKPTTISAEVAAPEQVIAGAYADALRWQAITSPASSTNTVLSADQLYQLAMQDLPNSLKGTVMDGSFRLDSNGRLIAEPSVVRIFEYFMSSIGEDSLETIIARVKHLIEAALPDSAKGDAHLLLAQYLDYRQQQGDLLQGEVQLSSNIEDLRETFNQAKQLRRDIFGVENAQSLFQDEESYMEFSLNSMELSRSQTGQTELEKINSLRALAVDLPESHKQVVEEQLVQRELDERTAQLKQANASSEELRLMREQLIGTEAAERLAQLDIQRSAWQQRVDDLRVAYQDGLSALGGSEDEKQALLQSLLAQHAHNESERKRMKAMLSGF